MKDSLFAQGVELMVTGMGMVFVFLTLLVFCTRFMSSAVRRFFPEPEEHLPVSSPRAELAPASIEKHILAVIQAAIHEHRTKRQ